MNKPIIGILGGGQLGMMLSDAAKKVGIQTHIYCPEDNCPASLSSEFFTKEDYNNKNAIEKPKNKLPLSPRKILFLSDLFRLKYK